MFANFQRDYARLVKGSASAAAIIVATAAFPAFAQSTAESKASADKSEQEIVVTGSRIARKDYSANSPIVTVGNDLIQNSGTSALEADLNQLPQFSPTGKVATAGGDIQPTATNTPGAATISLRGIGANRNLVLIDGRRATPSNASMAVDINTIPTAAIDRIEIISGGASSVYGADAIAGVTNFIMKKNFQGFAVDGQIGTTEHGDNTEWTVSGILGTNFADGRGNISIAMSTNTRKAAYQRNRSWYRDMWANPNIGGTQFFPATPGVYFNDLSNLPSTAVLNQVMGVTGWTSAAFASVYANPDGSAFSGFDVYSKAGVSANEIVDGYNYKQQANGLISKNNTDNLLILPLTRYNTFMRGNYEINDWISVFGDGTFSKVSTSTVQEPGPITSGWSVYVNNDGRDLPSEIKTILNSRSNPTGSFSVKWVLPFDRKSYTDVFTYNMTAGIDGKIPGTDWTLELFAQQGESETNVKQTGFVSLERLRTVMQAPNWGKNWSYKGNAVDSGFGASTATCTSGINPFSTTAISQDCIDAVTANLKTRAVMQQSLWEFDSQGALFALPAGTVRASVGASYRENSYHFDNDTYTTQGTMFNDQILGLYPAGNSSGKIVAKEVYGELVVPVLKDLPFARSVELELGARASDYNTTGTSYTWKALASWQPTEWLRFRGGYNRAERAPNIGELYLSAQQTFAYASGGDVCSTANPLAWSANPNAVGNTAANAAAVKALCQTIMTRSGGASAASTYYSGTQSAGGAFVFPTLTGNPNLSPEKAGTWTLGAVISSPFATDWLKRLKLSVDYYSIHVDDAIGAQSVDVAQRQCFSTAFNPTLDPNSSYCSGINRNATGGLGNVLITYYNNGRFRTQGVDFQLDWSKKIGPGTFSVNSVLNYLISLKSAELDVLPLVEYAGTTGPSQNGLDGGAYRWKLFTTFNYAVGPATIGIQWRHLPSVMTETSATVPTTSIVGAPAYDLFNLIGSVSVTHDVRFRFGVDNLFNKAPPLYGVDTNANTSVTGNLSGGSYNSTYYDTNGRRFYVGASFKF